MKTFLIYPLLLSLFLMACEPAIIEPAPEHFLGEWKYHQYVYKKQEADSLVTISISPTGDTYPLEVLAVGLIIGEGYPYSWKYDPHPEITIYRSPQDRSYHLSELSATRMVWQYRYRVRENFRWVTWVEEKVYAR